MPRARLSPAVLVSLTIILVFAWGAGAKKIVVTHWQHHNPARTEAVKLFVKEFEKENPDIEIDFQPMDWGAFMDKIPVALASGKGPDVCQLPCGLLPEYISKGVLAVAPRNVITAEFAEKSFLPFTTERLVYKGKIYGLPTDIQTILMYYNTDLFLRGGLDPNRPPKTWNDLKEYAIKMTKKDGSGKLLQSGFDWGWYLITLEAMMRGNGVQIVDSEFSKMLWDTDKGLETLEFMSDFYTKYKTTGGDFTQNKLAMSTNHPVWMGDLDKLKRLKYNVALLPSPDGKPSVTTGTHWAYVVPKATKDVEASWRWIKFLTSKENQIKWFQRSGDLPAYLDLVKHPDFKLNERMETALTSLGTAKLLSWVGWVEWTNLGNSLMDRIVNKHVGPAESLKQATQEGNIILKKKGISMANF